MTKQEKALFNDMLGTIKALESRIASLESKYAQFSRNIASTPEEPMTKSKSQKAPVVVGNLIFDGKYVKTGTGFMNSKTRYAIMKSITESFNGTKLTKGNPVFDKCHKEDKYVQVYEFKTVADCKKFMAEQQKRVG